MVFHSGESIEVPVIKKCHVYLDAGQKAGGKRVRELTGSGLQWRNIGLQSAKNPLGYSLLVGRAL